MTDQAGSVEPPEPVARALAEALATERLGIVASLIRTTGDWDLAEDAVADAAERALRRWPIDGVPDNPAAWLTTTARRRAIDLIRRAATERAKLTEIALTDELRDNSPADANMTFSNDDRLRLIFTCAHPALAMEARVALTLKVVAGLSTEAIASAFLTTEATMGQRLLRAKRKIAHAGIPYQVPPADALPERLDGVLATVYLIFTSGYARSAGDLAEEAIRLGRLLVRLLPYSDESRALLALMLLQHARRDARTVHGELVTLEEQDRSRWDRAMIDEALALLAWSAGNRGPYRLQAELAAVHATAQDAAATDWTRIVRLYEELLELAPSPVVALNRAIAVGMADGPLTGLAALDELGDEPRLAGYHLLPAARADLLARAGQQPDAIRVLEQAIALAPTEPERRQLTRRRDELLRQTPADPTVDTRDRPVR
ncbi:MAG TPA: sigma-70 family RNA polymerase sigma factor [Propionibacteriaceae bacterium]|nr:sigma-70 family RNA polymerase sigma factor [Propionibacteriaceae bacterium]